MAANKNHWKGIHGLIEPEAVYTYAKQGMSLLEISKLYGCAKSNISHAIQSNEELKDAWERGHAELLVEYTGQLKKRAFENDIMLMFALKTQCGYVEEQHRLGKQLEQVDAPRVMIYLPSNGRDSDFLPDNMADVVENSECQ